jgi:hypothetical protein
MDHLFKHINPVYFWDVDVNSLDSKINKRLIIERVINYGSLDELHILNNTYSRHEIINTLINLKCLDPKTQNFVTLLYNLPLKK